MPQPLTQEHIDDLIAGRERLWSMQAVGELLQYSTQSIYIWANPEKGFVRNDGVVVVLKTLKMGMYRRATTAAVSSFIMDAVEVDEPSGGVAPALNPVAMLA